jgi:hypothetical protein
MKIVGVLKKIVKNKFFSKIYEVFDLNGAYVNIVDEKCLMSSRNLMKF